MYPTKEDECTVGYTVYLDHTATPFWRKVERATLWDLIDGWTSGVFSIKCMPDDKIQRTHIEDGVSEYLLQKLRQKKANYQVMLI